MVTAIAIRNSVGAVGIGSRSQGKVAGSRGGWWSARQVRASELGPVKNHVVGAEIAADLVVERAEGMEPDAATLMDEDSPKENRDKMNKERTDGAGDDGGFNLLRLDHGSIRGCHSAEGGQ